VPGVGRRRCHQYLKGPRPRIGTAGPLDASCEAQKRCPLAAKSYRLLRAILNTAVDDDRIGRNPCRIKGAGSEQTDERPMLPTVTVLALADAIEPPFRALVLVAGFGGLRTGEMLGLTRADIDLEQASVTVHTQAQQIVGLGRIMTDPKSDAARRVVTLPELVVLSLGDHLRRWTAPADDSPVFVGPEGRPVTRATLSEIWRAAVAQTARMPGITTKELMARIGHASPRAALFYQHATVERDRAAADFLDHEIATVVRLRTSTEAPGCGVGARRQQPQNVGKHP
jgi:integrase